MTKDDILALSGDDLDALVAEHVMGLKPQVDFGRWPEHEWKRDEKGEVDEYACDTDENGSSRMCVRCYCTPDLWRTEDKADSECVVEPFEYSTSHYLLKPILDRMISLGWLPSLDYDPSDGGWRVEMWRKGQEDVPKFTSMNLNEAVCKAALLATGV